MRHTFLVGARPGGQGKTLVSHLVYVGHNDAGISLALAAADSVIGTPDSKLGKFFPGLVRELRIGLSLEEIRQSGAEAVAAHWDELGEIFLTGGTIVDLGANVSPIIWDWAAATNAGQILRRRNAPPITLVVPVRPQSQAVEDAVDLLERSVELQDALPIAHRVLVLNEVAGTFDRFGTTDDFRRLELLKNRHGLRVTRMPACQSALWPIIERQYLSFIDLLSLEPEAIETRLDLDPFAASRAQVDLVRWVRQTLASFRSVGLVPPEKPAGVSAAE